MVGSSAPGRVKPVNDDLQPSAKPKLFLHRPEGARLYLSIVDQKRRAFDFTDNTFKFGFELSAPSDACLTAVGCDQSLADYGYSYAVDFDLDRLLNGRTPESVRLEGANVVVHWFQQVGDTLDPTTDQRINALELRYREGRFESANEADQSRFDEGLAFKRRLEDRKRHDEFVQQEADRQKARGERVAVAVREGRVEKVLRIVSEDLCVWAANLQPHLVYLVNHQAKDRYYIRRCQEAAAPDHDSWVLREWIGGQEAYDLLEFHKSVEFALAFAGRLNGLQDERRRISEQLVAFVTRHIAADATAVFHVEQFRRKLMHKAVKLAEYIDNLALQFETNASGTPSSGSTSLEPSLVPTVPYSLRAAFQNLLKAIDASNEIYRSTRNYLKVEEVVAAVDRFSYEFSLVPHWNAEFERRAGFVADATRPGSPYAVFRRAALDRYSAEPDPEEDGSFALDALRGTRVEGEEYLSFLTDRLRFLESVSRNPVTGMSPESVTAFERWRDSCRSILLRAQRLEVDGCWYLLRAYQGTQPDASDWAKAARNSIKGSMGAVHLEEIRKAAESLVAWVSESGTGIGRHTETAEVPRVEPVDNSPPAPPTPQPFKGGELIFYADRVEICGVDICSGPRCRSKRIVLELLSQRRGEAFESYSGEKLEAESQKKGAKGKVVGIIRDLRDQIVVALRNEASLVVHRREVIQSGGSGYRFAQSLSVQFVDAPLFIHITDTTKPADVSDVSDVSDGSDGSDGSDLSETDGASVIHGHDALVRRAWILQQLENGVQLKAQMVATQFNCSIRTTYRDLDALKSKVEFVGDPRAGYYRLMAGK